MMVYSKLLAQQHEEEAQFESVLGSSRMKSEARSYGTSAYSSSMSRNQVGFLDAFNDLYYSFLFPIGNAGSRS